MAPMVEFDIMANSKTDSSNINEIGNALSIASLAPSVHNIQPWKVKYDAKQISIFPEFKLIHGDPTHRETYISIGAFLETLIIALANYGFGSKIITVDKHHLVISLNKTKIISQTDLFEAIPKRHTNRSKFKTSPVEKHHIQAILAQKITNPISKNIICKPFATTEKDQIERYAQLISQGIKIPMLSKDFCQELSELITQKSQFGIPYRSMGTKIPYSIFKYSLRTNKLANYVAKQEYTNWSSSPLIVSICSNGDSYKHWIDSGRLYQRCLLQATSFGYQSSTSATLVEALNFHEDIEEMLKTNYRLLATIRVGKATKKDVKSGRYALSDILVN